MALSFLYLMTCRLVGMLLGRLHSEYAKDVEIAVLRHQLKVLCRQVKRPEFQPADRAFLAMLSRALSRSLFWRGLRRDERIQGRGLLAQATLEDAHSGSDLPWWHRLKDSVNGHTVGLEPAFSRSAASEPTGDLRLAEVNPIQHELVPILDQIDRDRVAAASTRDDVGKKDGQVGVDPAADLGIVLIPWVAHGGYSRSSGSSRLGSSSLATRRSVSWRSCSATRATSR